MKREKIIIRTSIQGIIVNLVLVVFKATVGLISGSVAIALDALNNLTDTMSAIVTIIGTKLAHREPDREHPYGHGRIEYITTLLIGLIILFAGVGAIIEAVPRIFGPEKTEYSVISLIIIAVAVGVKVLLGRYVKGVGEKINSGSLIASGKDALFDAVLSFSTLVSAIISIVFKVNIDGWVGTVIAAFIIKASIEMLSEAWMDVVGRRMDSDLAQKIKNTICAFPEVQGAYDLTLHNYGPTDVIGSVHIQIPDNMKAQEIHRLTREISVAIYKKFGIVMTIGIYAENTTKRGDKKIRKRLEEVVAEYSEILQMHGFYIDEEKKTVAFDLIISFGCPDREKIKNKVVRKMKKEFPEYRFTVTLDVDMSD